jgi:hypothetical protein
VEKQNEKKGEVKILRKQRKTARIFVQCLQTDTNERRLVDSVVSKYVGGSIENIPHRVSCKEFHAESKVAVLVLSWY